MSGTVPTSPAAIYATTPLSDYEKVDVRRFCGYPIYGGEGPQGFVGYRFFQAFGLLEYRMTNLSQAELQNVRYHNATLYTLEAAIIGMSATLNVDAAAVFKRNADEQKEREKLFKSWQIKLCNCVGVPAGPDLGGAESSVRIVV